MHRGEITADFVAQLIAAQFPEWAALPVQPVALSGWDNLSFRLGGDKLVRIPSAEPYEAQVAKEHEWLPRLAPHLPLPIPKPLAFGQPDLGLPRTWSVYGWIEGEPAVGSSLGDLDTFAADLGAFLAALYAIDAEDGPLAGPLAGPHSFGRGGPVQAWDESTHAALHALDDLLDAGHALRVWEAAVAADDRPAPCVWVHGDVTGSNLLVRDRRLSAVIDFGCSAVGDPACDLTIAWTSLDAPSRRVFRELVPFDEPTWQRARGWAIWKALVTLHRARDAGRDLERGGHGLGWRLSPLAIVEVVIDDALRGSAG